MRNTEARKTPMEHWKGENKLGRCLMKVRGMIQKYEIPGEDGGSGTYPEQTQEEVEEGKEQLVHGGPVLVSK